MVGIDKLKGAILMTKTKEVAFEQLTEGVKQWVGLNGEYTEFEISESFSKGDGQEGFFLVDHGNYVEIIYAWISLFDNKTQISIEFRSNVSADQKETAKKIFHTFAHRLS